MLIFYGNTTKMSHVVRESVNTTEWTIALYFTWSENGVIFTFTALPRDDRPCQTIRLLGHYNHFHVLFQGGATLDRVIIIAHYI